MAQLHRIKQNFTAGEISPSMGMRTDLDRYKNGCKSLLNMYVKSQGPAVRRPGFEFVADLGEYTSINWSRRPRIVPFVFGATETFVLIFVPKMGASYYEIYVANSEGLIKDGDGNEVMATPESDRADTTWAAETTFTKDTYIVPVTQFTYPDEPRYYICLGDLSDPDNPADSGDSGSTEPTWPMGTGATVVDGDLTWKCLGTLTDPISTNQANFQYLQIGDIVYLAFGNGDRRPVEIRRKDSEGYTWHYAEVDFDNIPQQPGGSFRSSCSGVSFNSSSKCTKYSGTWVESGSCTGYTIEDDEDCEVANGIWIAECRDYRIYDELSCNEAGGRWVSKPRSDEFPYGGDCLGEWIKDEKHCENLIYMGKWYEQCEQIDIDNSDDCTTLGGSWDANAPICKGAYIDNKWDCIKENGSWDAMGSKPWWGPNQGWPITVSAYQQRLVFASTWKRPQTIWLSATQDLLNFNTSAGDNGLVPDQAMAFTLASEDQNKVQWLKATRSLVVGTHGDEWTIDGGAYNAITPTNVMAIRQTNQGSERVQPLLIGPAILFVERLGRIVNEFVYDYNYQSYKSNDMTVLAPHLTQNNSIVDWAYQQTPNSIIWAIRNDGTLLGLTYQREQKVVAWHRHTTDGYFISIGATPGSKRETDIWAVVARPSGVDGVNGRWSLEKLQVEYTGWQTVDGRFLDSHTSIQNPTTLDFTETRFAGKTIHAICDGIVHPPVEVDDDGNFSLDFGSSRVVYGLPYTSEVIPELNELELKDGSSMGRNQRIINVDILFYRSVGMEVGDGTNYTRVQARDASHNVNSASPLFSGYYKTNFPEGYDSDPILSIRQTLPLPLTVVGFIDTIEVHE